MSGSDHTNQIISVLVKFRKYFVEIMAGGRMEISINNLSTTT